MLKNKKGGLDIKLVIDPTTAYFLMPRAFNAEQLQEDTEIETEHGMQIFKAGDWILKNAFGYPVSIVPKQDFDTHYTKLSDVPDGIKAHIRKIIEWQNELQNEQ